MWYMGFIRAGISLADKASDGVLTSEEIEEVIQEIFPDFLVSIMERIQIIMADGKITVDEVFGVITDIMRD